MALVWPNIPFKVGLSFTRIHGAGLSFNLNSANARAAFVRRMSVGGTLSLLRIYISSVVGSPQAGDIRCQLYADGGNAPGSSIGNEVVPNTTPAVGFYDFDFSGQNITLTAGNRYWFVVRNANANPASNYVQVHQAVDPVSDGLGSVFFWGQCYTSTDGGSTYTATSINTMPFAVRLSDGTQDGLVFRVASNLSPNIFGDTMYGVRFTTPSDTKLRVVGAALSLNINNSPSGASLAIYSGGTTVAEASFPSQLPVSGHSGVFVAWFSSVVTLNGGQTYRLVCKNPQGNSSNYFRLPFVDIDSSTSSLAVLPLSSRYTYTTNGGSSWTEDNTKYPTQWVLFLDPEQPFEVPSGGGWGFPLGYQYIT